MVSVVTHIARGFRARDRAWRDAVALAIEAVKRVDPEGAHAPVLEEVRANVRRTREALAAAVGRDLDAAI